MRPAMRTCTRGSKLFGGSIAVLGQDLRNGMREIETMAVRLEAESFDFGDALDALAVQVVFKRQYGLLKQCYMAAIVVLLDVHCDVAQLRAISPNARWGYGG